MQNNSGGNIATKVTALISGAVESLGCRLWDVEFVREGADYYLRVTIDKDGGVTIDDCENVNRMIDPMLDEADPIENSYILEVSSPGIERELRTDAHLAASIGENVELRLFAPLDGAKTYSGKLSSFDDKSVTIETDGAARAVPRQSISKIKTVFDFTSIK